MLVWSGLALCTKRVAVAVAVAVVQERDLGAQTVYRQQYPWPP